MPQIKKEYNSNNPHPVNKHVGRVLKRIRATNGLTQKDMGDLLGYVPQQIHRKETAVNRLTPEDIDILRREFDIIADYFFPPLDGSEHELMKMTDEEVDLRCKASRKLIEDK